MLKMQFHSKSLTKKPGSSNRPKQFLSGYAINKVLAQSSRPLMARSRAAMSILETWSTQVMWAHLRQCSRLRTPINCTSTCMFLKTAPHSCASEMKSRSILAATLTKALKAASREPPARLTPLRARCRLMLKSPIPTDNCCQALTLKSL